MHCETSELRNSSEPPRKFSEKSLEIVGSSSEILTLHGIKNFMPLTPKKLVSIGMKAGRLQKVGHKVNRRWGKREWE